MVRDQERRPFPCVLLSGICISFSNIYEWGTATCHRRASTKAIEPVMAIPVLLLDASTIPHLSIGGGETIASIQYVSLQENDWDDGVRKLIEVIQPDAA